MPDKTVPDKTGPGGRAGAHTIAVIALLVLSVVALRGHLPGAERRTEPEQLGDAGPGSAVPVVALLAVSIAVLAISVLNQARLPSPAPSPGEPPRELRGDRGALRWRPVLIAAGILLAWAVVILLLMRWLPTWDPGAPPPPDNAADPAREAAGGPPTAPREAPQTPTDDGGTMFGILAGATIVMLLLVIAGTVLGRRRSPGSADAEGSGEAPIPAAVAGPDLARAAELGLAEMGDLSKDPRAAIIACYLAMERELEKSPGTFPRDSDTPAEVLARAIEHQALPAGSASVLVDLFEEARFSPHVMDEGHRADAMHALQSVQRDLQGVT